MLDERTDEELLADAARGDETAFRAVYERHRDAVFRFSYRMLGSAAAEDVTHDCFLSLLQNPSRFNASRAALRTYLYAAARNLALKQMERSVSSAASLDDLKSEPQAHEREEPLRRALDAELAAAVKRAIAQLPAQQREALILFEYEELSLAEIAAIVGADAGAVKARLHRARANLRQTLAPYFSRREREERLVLAEKRG